MKLWECELTITILEFSYTLSKIVKADTHDEALEIIKEYARNYYAEEGTEEFKDSFTFFGGCPIVNYGVLREITPEEWKEKQWKRALIGSD